MLERKQSPPDNKTFHINKKLALETITKKKVSIPNAKIEAGQQVFRLQEGNFIQIN